jgi:hypothetical protein
MELSPLYLQRLEEATQRGIELGIQQGKRQNLESILQVRFGEIDEELAQIIEPLIQLEFLEIARLSMQLDRSQLLARFEPSNPTES